MNMVFCFSDLAVLYAVTFKACTRYFFSCAVRGGLLVLSSLGDREAETRGSGEPLGAAAVGGGGGWKPVSLSQAPTCSWGGGASCTYGFLGAGR